MTIGHPISSIEGRATFSSREELPMISCPVGSRVAAGKFGEEAAYKEPNYSLASYYGTLDKWESGAGLRY